MIYKIIICPVEVNPNGHKWGVRCEHLQETADLFGELEQAVLALMQGSADGYRQPLTDAVSVSLIEELGRGAALALQLVEDRLSQQNRVWTDSAIYRRDRELNKYRKVSFIMMDAL